MLLGVLCAHAHAHAVLLGHWPANNQVVGSVPDRFILEFNEKVQPLRFGLFDIQGRQRDIIPPPAERSARINLRPSSALAPGSYLLSYRVTSADGHPVAGSLMFQFGAATAGSTALERLRQAAEADIWRLPVLAVRWLLYMSLLLGAGGTLALAVLRPAAAVGLQARKIALAASCAGLLILIPYHLLVAAELLGIPVGELARMPVWQLMLSGPHAANLATALIGLGLLIGGLGHARRLPAAAALLGAALVAVSFTMAGHAANAEPRWVVRTILFLHVAAGGFWLGALPLLLLAVLRLRQNAAPVLRRFAFYAVLAVAFVLAGGAFMGWVQTEGDVTTLWTTPYGQRLGLKIIAVGLLLAVAATNRFVLTPRLAVAAGGAERPLALLLWLDLGLATLVIGATASLNMDPPPRIARMHMGQDISPLAAGLQMRLAPAGTGTAPSAARQDSVAVSFAPNTMGHTSLVLDYLDPEGRLLHAQDAAVTLALPDRSIEGLRWRATPDQAGRLRADGVAVPFAGKWTITVELFIDDFTRRVFKGEARFEPGAGMSMAGMPGMPGMGPADSASVAPPVSAITGDNVAAGTAPRTPPPGGDDMAGMMMSDFNGAVMNDDPDRLPIDCPVLAGDQTIIVHVGRRYAQPGTMFGYDRTVWNAPGCTRVNLTLVNEDNVRHQFMMHGLPRYLYPQGMLHVEAEGGTSRSASFIIPGTRRTYFVHCDMAQHTEKGLKAELKGAGGSGDLPNIPGLTGAVVPLQIPLRWSEPQLAAFFAGLVAAAVLLIVAIAPRRLLPGFAMPRREPHAARGRAEHEVTR